MKLDKAQAVYAPLETVVVTGAHDGHITVLDGAGEEYARMPAADASFVVGGALGTHTILLRDEEDRLLDTASFRVQAETELKDSGGRYGELLKALYWTIISKQHAGGATRFNGRIYRYFVCWLRDHVHALKGLKYFNPELKSGIDLYAETQREDGMIFDNVYPRTPERNMWDERFEYGDFIRHIENDTWEMKRIPVENDVEYLFLEGIYYTWKATGDTVWMSGLLDSAIKAVEYSTSDPYRWSQKYKLLKRGYTIDTWDFQSNMDRAVTGDAMAIDKDKSQFGVMFGDNTGFVAGLRYLGEMLTTAGRAKEADRYCKLADEMAARLDKLAWNGKHYRHHVPEDPTVERDFGVDTEKQVSLSNAYSINRGIDRGKASAIVKTYQRIRRHLPHGSPGEWYQIYPPFERGFGSAKSKWQYMNGGVTTIVAGELSHGAFENGFEDYGVDILDRLAKLGKRHDDYFHCTYRGAMPEPPKRKFTCLDMRGVMNADFHGDGADGVPGWTGEGDNDLRQISVGRRTFHGIPTKIVDPTKNGRRACLGLSAREGYAAEARVPVGDKAASIYFHHTMGQGKIAGTVTVEYADGTTHSEIIGPGSIGGWWMPSDRLDGWHSMPACRVAWRGANARVGNVGTYIYGMNNPHPRKTIDNIVFEAAKDGAQWMVLGVTLCDKEVFFMPSDLSGGIPDNWGAGTVVYALIEGLAGVKDEGVAYDAALIAPRWSAAGVRRADATVTYPASGGYVAYRWKETRGGQTLHLTTSGDEKRIRLLLPASKKVGRVTVNGEAVKATVERVGKSRYAVLDCKGRGVSELRLTYAASSRDGKKG